jgi:hypothetical protein
MKRKFTVIGLLLLLLIAGNGCRDGKHGSNDMNDHSEKMRMRMGQNFHYRRGNESTADSLRMKDMSRGMGPRMMRRMDHRMMRGMGTGMMGGMGHMPMANNGWMPMGPGIRILESVPNVTESQKKLIEDLMKKDREEMIKLREEMSGKMHELADSHRKEVLSILTDEQKKFIESGHERPFSAPEKTK